MTSTASPASLGPVSAIRVLSAGSEARRIVETARSPAIVHSAYDGAVNLSIGKGLVSVVPERVGRGPINLVVGRDFGELRIVRQGESVAVTDGSLHFSRRVRLSLSDSEVYEPTRDFRLPVLSDAEVEGNLHVARSVLLAKGRLDGIGWILHPEGWIATGPISEPMKAGAAALADGFALGNRRLVSDAAKRFLGLGIGLTPAADDFSCGLMATLILGRANGVGGGASLFQCASEVLSASETMTTTLSQAFIREASHGRANEKVIDSIKSIFTQTHDQVTRAFSTLSRFGHSSGTDIGTGIIYGARASLRNNGADPRC